MAPRQDSKLKAGIETMTDGVIAGESARNSASIVATTGGTAMTDAAIGTTGGIAIAGTTGTGMTFVATTAAIIAAGGTTIATMAATKEIEDRHNPRRDGRPRPSG